jgi:ADP-ribose pyrophosphatase YjhB (NUDIX family)
VPAVAALVVDDDRLLLGRRAVEPALGLWDTIGGFVEEDEDAMDALRREVHEETGLVVSAGRFVGAFSDRYGDAEDAPTVLTLAWEARVVSGESRPADDVSELAWFTLDALPADDELAFGWIAAALRQWVDPR